MVADPERAEAGLLGAPRELADLWVGPSCRGRHDDPELHPRDATGARRLLARSLPVVRDDVHPRLALGQEDPLPRGILEDEWVGVARAAPRRFLPETVAAD